MYIATRFCIALDSASLLGGLHGNKRSVTVKASHSRQCRLRSGYRCLYVLLRISCASACASMSNGSHYP